MTRTRQNVVVDSLAYLGLVVLMSTGFLLRYWLPPGSGGTHPVGGGQRGQNKTIELLWGWSRHEWGDFHYWVALVLMGILTVHLLLHWKWIVCVLRGHPQNEASGMRLAWGLLGLAGVTLLACTPLVSPTEKVLRSQLPEPSAAGPMDERHEPWIQGKMTFREIISRTGIPLSYLITKLELPEDLSPEERVGRVVRAAGYELEDLRRAIQEYSPPPQPRDSLKTVHPLDPEASISPAKTGLLLVALTHLPRRGL